MGTLRIYLLAFTLVCVTRHDPHLKLEMLACMTLSSVLAEGTALTTLPSLDPHDYTLLSQMFSRSNWKQLPIAILSFT